MKKIKLEIEVTEQIEDKIQSGISIAYLRELLKNDVMLGHRTKIEVIK